MKKFISLLSVICLTVVLAACGESGEQKELLKRAKTLKNMNMFIMRY